MTIIAVAVAFIFGVALGTIEGQTVWTWLTTRSPAKVLASAEALVAAEEARLAALVTARAVVAAAPKPAVAPPPAA